MKIISMTKYRLHRYFYSSYPVIPLIATVCFLECMYSVKPMDVCSGYILSGIFQFVLLIFVALSMNGKEETVEEQIILFHGNCWKTYCMAREINLLVISCFYGVILSFGPVIINCFNHFSFFTRTLTVDDVVKGAIIIFGSGFAGIAIGDIFHPRIIGDRKIGIAATVGMMIFSIAKEAIIQEYPFLKLFGILLPSVTKPELDLGNTDYFEIKSVVSFLIMMIMYYMVVVIIKNLVLKRKKFS